VRIPDKQCWEHRMLPVPLLLCLCCTKLCLQLWAKLSMRPVTTPCGSGSSPNVSHARVRRREVGIIPVVVQPGWLLLLQAPGHP
jgi:hypothetical protein